MVEETAIRVQINAAKLAGQGIFGILQAVASMLQARQYGQQSIQSLNRQSQALASVELNDKTLPYVRRQLKEYSVDFAITKDKDTGQLNLWFKALLHCWKRCLQPKTKKSSKSASSFTPMAIPMRS